MRYIPLANRVLVEEIEESKVTSGGLLIPDVARKNKGIAFGKVISVGPGRHTADGKLIPCHVRPGDVVMFPRQAPAVLPLPDEHGNETAVLLLPENDVICIVEDLPQQTSLVGLDGALLKMRPVSSALPDLVYQNRDETDRTVRELQQVGAPPDVIAEAAMVDE